MKKIKLLGFLVIILGLFFAVPRIIDAQFIFETVCQPPLTTFSNESSTFDISFPPGGGTTCDTFPLADSNCPTIMLPKGATVFSMKVDMELSDLASEIGTPYIWIPNSTSGTFAQIRTADGTLVKLYKNGVDAFPADAFSVANSGISRVTVVPGADVYVANRGNTKITRLTPNLAPAEDYQYGGQLEMGEDYIRSVTFDKNGYVWGATCGNAAEDRIRVFCGMNTTNPACTSFDVQLAELKNGKCHYGAIGDKYGFVWTVGSGEVRSYSYSSGVITEVDPEPVLSSYGIGIDNDANIWVGDWTAGSCGVYKVTRNSSGGIISVNPYNSGLVANSGVAADGTTPLGNVWVAGYSTNKVSRFQTDGTFIANYDVGTTPHGVAIDFDNNAWVVNIGGGAPAPNSVLNPSSCPTAGTGSVTKLASDGTYIATYTTCGDGPYNYSDMTGLRTVPKSIIVSGISSPLSSTNTFTVCTDGVEDCNDESKDADPCSLIKTFLSTCTPDAMNNCEVPLEIFSMQAGDYTLKNLEVVYGKLTPVTTGGLVPCGRDWDDPDTLLFDETDPCDLCFLVMLINKIINFLLALAAAIAMLALVITGFLFITSAGNEERRTSAKRALKMTLIGFFIIFISWLMIDFLLSAWGYLDPLGGKWNVVCD